MDYNHEIGSSILGAIFAVVGVMLPWITGVIVILKWIF